MRLLELFPVVRNLRAENRALNLRIIETEMHENVSRETIANLSANYEALKRSIEATEASHAAEITRLQQMVDALSLGQIGRQVFGTAPQQPMVRESEPQEHATRLTGRNLVDLATQQAWKEAQERRNEFLRQAEEHYKNLQNGVTEEPTEGYSSTAKAVA